MTAANGLARRLRRHWTLLAACAVFLLAGALALDDYGITQDEFTQRRVGKAALDYLGGDGERAFDQLVNAHDRYYGAALEAPLVLFERIPGLGDSRDISLGRHLFTHLLYLLGGVFCYLLVYRLFNHRWLAIVAMILFLLHPRIYAHSFFNSKDIPFLATFMVSLYLVHRAFRRDTLGAYVLCGACAGILINLRILGVLLLVGVVALRALDLLLAGSGRERGRVALTGGAFALTAILTFHASLPALWTDPFGQFVEMLRVLRSHPNPAVDLFQGAWRYAPNGPPLDYAPVWIGITTPPATILLALSGALALAWRGWRRPRDLVHNGPLRFGVLLLALPACTLIAVVVFRNNIYTDWHHLYFLSAPLALLATLGIQWLAASFRGRWGRAGAYTLAGAAIAVAIVSMVRIHPHQDSYFTSMADRTTPEWLASRYTMNYWHQSALAVLSDIVADHPSGRLFVTVPFASRNSRLLPPAERERITARARDFHSGERNFHALADHRLCPASPLPAGASVSRVYANTLYCLVDPVAYFGSLRRAVTEMEPLGRSRFDAYRVGSAMVYVRDGCSPEDLHARTFLRVFPADPTDLPSPASLPPTVYPHHRGYEFEKLDFTFRSHGVRIDGDCVAAVPLPDHPIARIRTGQFTPEYAEGARRAVAGADPLAGAFFDIHLDPDGRVLTYVRDECSTADVGPSFFLHIFPADDDALPAHRRGHGFDDLGFGLPEYGARTDGGGCVATVPLPAYRIAVIKTGQTTVGGQLWAAEFAWPDGE